ncbi:TetR/AcrR family transcriptional regulator [Paractinoplanes ferrugineus]|uniref:TetR family transcriptional regulator n=1 Tax=Paractinoplanes ferrugineus TaxID=113564 RepID=A0A919J7D2_9ACTN|nr:TetR/AcrR family transcriptional regulator [Actinoplanes ferrugineus]GIE14954.1 TetR family transcriptional regulator [Actinoplanes ferrugineus]
MKRDTIASRRAGATDDKRRRIVEAAARAIEEHGTEAGLAAIADQAGVARPHVYRHFTGKDDLDREVARHAARLLSAWIRPSLTASGTPAAVINGLIARVVAWAVDHPNLYRFRARLGERGAVGELVDALAAYLRAAGYDTRPPAYVVAGIVGMVDAGLVWWLDHPDETGPDALTGWLADQVWLVLRDLLRRVGHPVDPAIILSPV